MDAAKFAELSSWLTEAGLAGNSETEIVDGFCGRAVTAGLPIARAMVIIDTLHPVHEGRVVRWRREGQERQAELIEYGPTSEGEAAESWQRSAFFRLREEGGSRLRRRLVAGQPAEFPAVVTLQNEGMTDYLALVTRFAADGVIGEMDCVYSSWATDHPRGFDDREVEALIGLMPLLALAVKCVSLTRIAGTLVETYLGRDAGRRVVAGPAVNEVSRIATMCRSAERNVLLSAAFAQAVAEAERSRLVSVGRYALRGVERPQELFTLIPVV